MPLEYEIRNGSLLWVKNPFTGVVSYVVDVRRKSFAFTVQNRSGPALFGQRPIQDGPVLEPAVIKRATATCPFCPGNENLAPPALMTLAPGEVAGWNGAESAHEAGWVMRAFNNLFPRIPSELTGDRNESYVVVEDPRHFQKEPRALSDLMMTADLGEEHFLQLIQCDVEVMKLSLANPAVSSVIIRKNQGSEAGASQPHPHQQIIGSGAPMPVLEVERQVQQRNPDVWDQIVEFIRKADLVIEERDGVITYASPIGQFPRSYDIVMPAYRGLLSELGTDRIRSFARAMYRIIRVLGTMPFDYEIHHGLEMMPLHAHINTRHFPYSNVGGTLNLPTTMLEGAVAIRDLLRSAP